MRGIIDSAVDGLKPRVDELNRALAGDGAASYLKDNMRINMCAQAAIASEMGEEWAAKLGEWLPGAAEDLVRLLCTPYRKIDVPRMECDMEELMEEYPEDDEGEIMGRLALAEYVREGARRSVSLGSMGSVWIDLPLAGTVGGARVAKMTRCAFVLDPAGMWAVHLDPTCDGQDVFDAPGAASYINSMTYESVLRAVPPGSGRA